MKKIIQFLTIIILLFVLAVLVILFFNPGGYRDKLLADAINGYLSQNIEGYQALPQANSKSYEESGVDNPLIPNEQEKVLYEMGINTASLPTEITPSMATCFEQKLGKQRTQEIVNGSMPSSIDIYKAKDCL